MDNIVVPFALYGAEKMFYDHRMGPQLVRDKDYLYCVYQAGENTVLTDPYIVRYSITEKRWAGPFKVGIGDKSGYDHHLTPVMWFDADGYIHVLFNCHGGMGTHRVSVKPFDIENFTDGPVISPSMSYPHVFRMEGNDVGLFFRAFGHMGYWGYCISHDGGYTWSKMVKVVDFDQDPLNDADTWAGSYHTVELDEDGHTLHVAFTYFDERGIWKFVHPRYNRKPSVNTRYNTYYLSIDMVSGQIRNIQGDLVTDVLNRKNAECAKIWDSGDYLTMQPAILKLKNGEMGFLLPETGETEWDCSFYFLKRTKGEWKRFRVTSTNTTWSGSRLTYSGDELVAYLILGKTDGSIYTYGAGNLEKWISHDDGETWDKVNEFIPEKGDLYNNPIFAEDSHNSGIKYPEFVAFYGWTGPYSIQPVIDKETDIPIVNRGRAYLLQNDSYVQGECNE